MKVSLYLNSMQQTPLYTDDKRYKNWCALVQLDPTAPGGFEREFLDRSQAEGFFYNLPNRSIKGRVLEFASDLQYRTGTRKMNREYYLVIQQSETELLLKKIGSKKAAQTLLLKKVYNDDI